MKSSSVKLGRIKAKRCKTMLDVRREIDRLDRRIVKLLAERSAYVGEAARIKDRASQIVDRARIEVVVDKARMRAKEFGADGETIAAIYRAMIDAFIAYERKQFGKKKKR